jgi:hypothetical protein
MLPASASAARHTARQMMPANVGQTSGDQPTAGSTPDGVPTATPTGQAVSGTLEQTTGLAPSDVQLQDVCPEVGVGYARCAAQALVLHSNHHLVRPDVSDTRPMRVRAGSAQPAVASPAVAAAATAPVAGTPAYLQQAYDLTYLSQTGGHGETVAIVDAYDDPTAEADLGTYRSTSGLSACTTANGCFQKVNENSAASPLPAKDTGWEEEISLDLDAVSALCPNCRIVLVEANSSSSADLTAAMRAAAAKGATQISDSWSVTSSVPPAGTYTFPGVDVVAATGDHGYPGAGTDNYPAAFAGVTAAGGTTLALASGGQGVRGFAESAWSLSGGWGGSSGCDLQLPKPAYQSDTGCTGRSYADISADANPSTGLKIYDSGNGGWLMMGGTSLATPLIAAYYAITGVSAVTPQWAYTSSSVLNDLTSGSNGSCSQSIAYICNAGTGFDGPTGVGSISGGIAAGAPGIGGPSIGSGSNNTFTQATTSINATLAGGIYPNALATSWWVEYGTTTSYGQHTAPADLGSGQTPVALSSTITGLMPGTTYHYRLVAQNSAGTTYGYDYTLRTAAAGASPPVDNVPPVISGVVQRASTLSATAGSWSGNISSYVYQWQRSTDGGSTWSSISGATGPTYSPGLREEFARLRVYVSASGAGGTASALSAATGAVAMAPPIVASLPTVTGSAQVGSVLTAQPGGWAPATGNTFAFLWQRRYGSGSYQNIPGVSGTAYTAAPNDLGDTIRVIVTVSNVDGSATATSAATGSIAAAPVATSRQGGSAPVAAGPHGAAGQHGAPSATALPEVSGRASVGSNLSIKSGAFSGAPASSAVVRVMRCMQTCVAVGARNARSYKISAGDIGAVLRVTETASNGGGSNTVWSGSSIGPVTSASAGYAIVGSGHATVRAGNGRTLALASVSSAASARAHHSAHGPEVKLRNARGRVRAWACPVSSARGGAPPRCSPAITFTGSGTLRLPAGAGGKLRVVVVSSRRR